MKGATKHSMVKTIESIRTTYHQCSKLMDDVRDIRFGRYGMN